MEQTASGLYVPAGLGSSINVLDSQEDEASGALGKLVQGMEKLEHHFPQLVRMAVDLAGCLHNAAKRRMLPPKAIMLAAPSWHMNGDVVVRLGFDELAERSTKVDDKVGTYQTLRQVNEDMPQVVDMAMTVAFQLVPAINARKIHPRDIEFIKLRFAADDSFIAFTVSERGKGLALPSHVGI